MSSDNIYKLYIEPHQEYMKELMENWVMPDDFYDGDEVHITDPTTHPMWGRKHTEEHIKSITGKGNPRYGKVGANKGRVWETEIRNKISETMKGKNPAVNSMTDKCKYCGIETNLGMLARWHNENCKHK
jgi:hypothetical protein